MLEIKTSDLVKTTRIKIDSNDWQVKPFGAGYQLSLTQAGRRVKLLTKKIEDGTATEKDYDLCDKLEKQLVSIYSEILSDGTEENKSVKKWVEETPLQILTKIFKQITDEVNGDED